MMSLLVIIFVKNKIRECTQCNASTLDLSMPNYAMNENEIIERQSPKEGIWKFLLALFCN
jgi:hypothetical protein